MGRRAAQFHCALQTRGLQSMCELWLSNRIKTGLSGLGFMRAMKKCMKKVKKCWSVIIQFCVQHLQTPLVQLWWNVAWHELLGTPKMEIELHLQLILLHTMLRFHLTLQLTPYCNSSLYHFFLIMGLYIRAICAGLIFYSLSFISHDVTYNCYRFWLFITRLIH